jgi:serine/threonine protein phosphatase PrpC
MSPWWPWKDSPADESDPAGAKAHTPAPPDEAADAQPSATRERNEADETGALPPGSPDQSKDGGQSAPVRHEQHVGRHAAGGRDSVDNTAAQGDANRAEGRDDQERPTAQGEPVDDQDMTAILRSVQESGQPAQVVVYKYVVSSSRVSEEDAPAQEHWQRGVAQPEDPVRSTERATMNMPTAAPPPKVRDFVEMPHATPQAHEQVDTPTTPPKERGVVTLPATIPPEDQGSADVPTAAPVPKVREEMAMPPTPPRAGQQARADAPTAAPVPKVREEMAMPPAPTSPAEEEPGDRAVARFPAPAVLVGNPRLGSAPSKPPRAKRSPADSILDGAQFAGFTVRAASLRGDEHRYNCDPRQDSIGLWALDRPPGLDSGDDLLLMCVADGVGNCPLSHLGSSEACWLLRQHVEAHIAALTSAKETEVLRACQRVIDEVAAGLRVLADSHGLAAKEVSTTLTAGLVVPVKKRSGVAADALVFRVGDSPGFLLRKSEWIPIASKSSDEDDVYSTGTDALPTRPETCQVETHRLLAGDMLMLCSDGLSGPMNSENVLGQLAEWWGGHAPSLPEFYWQMSFRAQTYGDDRSAVCVWVGSQ